MAIHAAFFKDKNFSGDVDTDDLTDAHRYFWIKYGSDFGNEISSFRAHAFGSHHGTVYAMTERDFTGKFISLNIKTNKFARWSSVGAALDDNIESVLMVNRNANEFEIELREVIVQEFDLTLDELFSGTKISRIGKPSVFTTFWPTYDPTRSFVSIVQELHIELDNWPDYNAKVQYDIFISLDSSGHVQSSVKWKHIWVDTGFFSNYILNEIQPLLKDNVEFLGVNFHGVLASKIPARKFNGLYLLPGPKPTAALGDKGDTKSNSTLVLIL